MITPVAAALAGAVAVQRAVALQTAIATAGAQALAVTPPSGRQPAPEVPGDAVAIRSNRGLILADVNRDEIEVDEDAGGLRLNTDEALMSPHPVDLEEVR